MLKNDLQGVFSVSSASVPIMYPCSRVILQMLSVVRSVLKEYSCGRSVLLVYIDLKSVYGRAPIGLSCEYFGSSCVMTNFFRFCKSKFTFSMLS